MGECCILRYTPVNRGVTYTALVKTDVVVELTLVDVEHDEIRGYFALDLPFVHMLEPAGSRLRTFVRVIHETRLRARQDDAVALLLLLMRIWTYEAEHGPSVLGRSLREMLRDTAEGFRAEIKDVFREAMNTRLRGVSVVDAMALRKMARVTAAAAIRDYNDDNDGF